MEPNLLASFETALTELYPDRPVPDPIKRELWDVFTHGAHAVLTAIPLGNLSAAQGTVDRLRQQCHEQFELRAKTVDESTFAQDAPATPPAAPAATDAPAATSDSPNSDLPLSTN